MVDFFFFFLSRQAKTLRWSQDHFSNILTQAACCVVCKSPIFFLREINTAHYLAEKRSLCQAAAHSTGRQPPSGLSHFSKMDNRLIAFVLNYPFWTKTAPLRRPISFPQAAKELLHKWTPPALGKMGTGEKKNNPPAKHFLYSWYNGCKFSCCFYVISFLLGSGYFIFGFSARMWDSVLQGW